VKDLRELDKYRTKVPPKCVSEGTGELDLRCNGAFFFSIKSVPVIVIAGSGRGWEHISVSCEDRTPTWEEMDTVKRVFFNDDEVVMQLHVTVKDHINIHPFCLHLWRPISKLRRIPLPPKDLV
jgi:Rap1a immunity proteins